MLFSLRRIAVLSVVGIDIALAAGCSAPSDGEDDDGLIDDGQEPDDESGPVASVGQELGGCYQCSDCVLYARCRQPRLPYGLTYWRDKVAQINSHTPRRGCVAVVKTSSIYGLVAYVNGVSNGRISIDEGNWPNGHCGQRSGTPAGLDVAGYICP